MLEKFGLSYYRKISNFGIAVLKSMGTFQNIDGRSRETSFPFISGDTYRAMATHYFDLEFAGRLARGIREMPPNPRESRSVVFVECILLRNQSFEDELRKWVDSRGFPQGVKFVFGNGDDPPRPELRAFLTHRGHKVFSHNLLDGEEDVTPIPLGLQNATHRSFGVIDDFLLFLDESRHPPLSERQRDVLVYGSFSLRSNRSEREKLSQLLANSRFGFSEPNRSVRENRAMLLRSKFVPSPSGVGPDCYRTWESIYLGAIPVLRSGTIAQSITDDLPVWIVDDWEELTDSSDEDLERKYSVLRSRSIRKSLFPYWQSIIGAGPENY